MNQLCDRLRDVVVVHVEQRAGSLAGSPIVDIIIALLPVLLQLLGSCPAPTALGQAHSPNLVSRIRLRLEIRRHLPDDDGDTRAMIEHLVTGFLAAGRTLTEDDLKTVSAG